MCTCWWIFLKEWESQGSVEVQVSGKCLDSADVTVTGLHRIRVSISASTGANLLFRLRPTHICVHSRLQFSLSSVSLLPEGQSSVTLTSDVTRWDSVCSTAFWTFFRHNTNCGQLFWHGGSQWNWPVKVRDPFRGSWSLVSQTLTCMLSMSGFKYRLLSGRKANENIPCPGCDPREMVTS